MHFQFIKRSVRKHFKNKQLENIWKKKKVLEKIVKLGFFFYLKLEMKYQKCLSFKFDQLKNSCFINTGQNMSYVLGVIFIALLDFILK